MSLSEETWTIRHALAQSLHETSFVEQRWLRINSVTNQTFNRNGTEVKNPVEGFCVLLNVTPEKANEHLHAAKLLVPHKTKRNKLSVNRRDWDALKAMCNLDIELEAAKDVKHLGKRQWFLRVGCLPSNETAFAAKDQAKRYFVGDGEHGVGWTPKRLRATRQGNDFISQTSFALSVHLGLENTAAEEEDEESAVEEEAAEKQPVAAAKVTPEQSNNAQSVGSHGQLHADSLTADGTRTSSPLRESAQESLPAWFPEVSALLFAFWRLACSCSSRRSKASKS